MGRVGLVLCVVFWLGCSSGGSPDPEDAATPERTWKAGDTCGGVGVFYGGLTAGAICADAGLALECRGSSGLTDAGVLAPVPCRGVNGCARTVDNRILCDNLTGVLPGDGCMLAQETTAVCSQDAGTYFQCSDGGFVQGPHCDGGCALSGGNVYCYP